MPEDDVSATLDELERKLEDLETELQGAAGASDPSPGAVGPAEEPPQTSAVAAALASSSGPFAGPAPAPAAPAREPGAQASVWTEPRALHDRLVDLERLHAHLERAARELLTDFGQLLDGLQAAVGSPPAAALPPADTAPGPLDAVVLQGTITVEAGPFFDVATLARFEQALAAVPGVRDARVRTLAGARAEIDVVAGEPVALGAELHRVSPLAFTTSGAGDGRLTLAVGPTG